MNKGFDPQALTSLTNNVPFADSRLHSFDPQALTSLTKRKFYGMEGMDRFDPQALTSLTALPYEVKVKRAVSIHRLLRA